VKVNLTTDEVDVLKRYRDHLWRIVNIREPGGLVGVLYRIVMECGQELGMIEKDLRAEDARDLRRCKK